METKHGGTIAPLVMNDPDPDGTPHWKFRLHWAGVWRPESFPTRAEAEAARREALSVVMSPQGSLGSILAAPERVCETCGSDLKAKADAAGVSLDPLACYCGPECDPSGDD